MEAKSGEMLRPKEKRKSSDFTKSKTIRIICDKYLTGKPDVHYIKVNFLFSFVRTRHEDGSIRDVLY